jgi:hypothetical protein
MNGFDYDNKHFRGVENYNSGDANQDTRFHYRQKGDSVWGIYEGGNIAIGSFVAKCHSDGRLDMLWQYLSKDGRLQHGSCQSTPERLPGGRIRLHESWQVFGASGEKGSSAIEEIL